MPLHLVQVIGRWSADDWLCTLAEYVLEGGDPNAVYERDGRNLLQYAMDKGCLECVQFLIDKGASVNGAGSRGRTALHHAVDLDVDGAIQNNWPMVMAWTRFLLRNGASTDVTNAAGKTPRDVAAAYGPNAMAAYARALEEAGR